MGLSKQSVAVLNKVNDYLKRRTEAIEGMTFFSEAYRKIVVKPLALAMGI